MRASKPTQAKGSLLTALSIVLLVIVSTQGRAHANATPIVSNQASSSGYPVGSQIFDSAMLGYGLNPTGWLIFSLYGPEDPTCAGTPRLTTHTAVKGNGYYESSRYVTNVAGSYQWTVYYGGDANNSASAPTLCSDPTGEVAMAKRTPQLNTSPSLSASSTTITGTLSGGAGPSGPTGTMTYRLYGAGNMTCAGAPIFTASKTVTGNGDYTSPSFSPTTPGTYEWVVYYSGDANNVALSTVCSDTNNGVTVGSADSDDAVDSDDPVGPVGSVSVSGSPTTIARGGKVTARWSGVSAPTTGDWVGLYKTSTADGGSVVSWKYTGGSATGSVYLKLPWGTAPGTYEVRLMANNSIERLATSAPITLVW